jgi:hypothetical protein
MEATLQAVLGPRLTRPATRVWLSCFLLFATSNTITCLSDRVVIIHHAWTCTIEVANLQDDDSGSYYA